MLNFVFLENGLRTVSPPCMIFQEKCFSRYISSTDQISSSLISLPLILEMLPNICIAIVC